MKVGVIGSGFVGSAAANAIALRGSAAGMVLINLNEKLVQAQAEDSIRWGGAYEAGQERTAIHRLFFHGDRN